MQVFTQGFVTFHATTLDAAPVLLGQYSILYLLIVSHHFGFIFIPTDHNLKDCPIALVSKTLHIQNA